MESCIATSDGRRLEDVPRPRWWQLWKWIAWLRSGEHVRITTADGKSVLVRARWERTALATHEEEQN
jgi:hypothetical protein